MPPPDLLPGAIPVSAADGAGVDQLLARIEAELNEGTRVFWLLVPFASYGLLDRLHRAGVVYRQEHRQASSDLDDVPAAHPALVQEPVAIERTYDAWQVRQALDELPADERQIIQLQHLEGLSQTAVAQRLGVPVGTVKSRSFRAHKKLAGRLGHLREGFD